MALSLVSRMSRSPAEGRCLASPSRGDFWGWLKNSISNLEPIEGITNLFSCSEKRFLACTGTEKGEEGRGG